MARPKGANKTVSISLRISPETADVWDRLAQELGISRTGCFEQAIRRMAKTEGVDINHDGKRPIQADADVEERSP